ncbi:MAG: tyrosine-type recombinase/integrase [Acidimicrobiales bacterium]
MKATKRSGRYWVLAPHQEALVNEYVAFVAAAGLRAGRKEATEVKAFCGLFGDPKEWAALPLAKQLAIPVYLRPVVARFFLMGKLAAPAEYLIAAHPCLGSIAARHDPDFFAEFVAMAAKVGNSAVRAAGRDWERRQWNHLVMMAAVEGVSASQITAAQLDAGREKLWRAARAQGRDAFAKRIVMCHFETSSTLFHLGRIDSFPERVHLSAREDFDARWAACAPGVAATIRAYLAQRAAVRRPSTVNGERQCLMQFAEFLAKEAPDVASLAQLRREHIEAFKLDLATRAPQWRGRPVGGHAAQKLSRRTVYRRLCIVKNLIDRLQEQDAPDAPVGKLVLPDDLPIEDKPLPRFIDDAAFAKLLVAARADDDPFVRLAVEFLARTGLRIGEFLDLTTDAVVQIGSGYWLRVPIGKLHNDRYIPLHPQLKALLDDWMVGRAPELRTSYVFMLHGRRISRAHIRRGLDRVAERAEIGHVTPHQLRHTLATQAINRGMSLEALATLLGHKTLAMTLVYARIADRTVADEYFSVSEKVEALYDQPKTLPADAEGSEMAKLRREMHRRMLGNGYCARPVELDCHFESICESCTYFVTTVEFRPTLKAQRDDAEAKGQVGRVKVFEGLLSRLDTEAS